MFANIQTQNHRIFKRYYFHMNQRYLNAKKEGTLLGNKERSDKNL